MSEQKVHEKKRSRAHINPSNTDDLDTKTLFVRSLPTDVTDEELSNYFSNFAPIRHAVVVKDNEKRSRGFGFVTFAAESDTKEALHQARKTKLKNHTIRVDIAKRRDRGKKNERTAKDESSDNTQKEDEEESKSNERTFKKEVDTDEKDDDEEDSEFKGKPKLIIRNLPWSCKDPNKLKKIFTRFGTVVEATIPKKRDGKLCGFGFVTMKKISNCRLALEQTKDLKIDGRAVAVDFAVEKNRWEKYKTVQQDAEEKKEGEQAEESSDSDSSNSGEESSTSDVELSDEELVSGEEDEEDVESEEEEQEKKRPKQNRQENFSIFVRNVPYDATQESLTEHFEKFGPVKYALPVIDKETGLAKGTAFVAFRDEKTYNHCVENAPEAGSTSLLIGDNVLPEYVYEGRVLSVTPTLVREHANRMAEKNAAKRKEILGKAPDERDKRNMYLLNEGKVVEGTKLASLLTKTDLEIREKSYNLRVEQLKKNPTLHLSMTRLAIRNLPRAMNEKALKALARKGVVEFATEVKDGKRHPLSKEEIIRSTKEKYKFMSDEEIERQKKKDKKQGLVRQAKIIMEVKGTTIGRSRGYGFVEYRDHKSALMGLRWLNVHKVSKEEILEGATDEEKRHIKPEALAGRRLVVEFAIENANVVKRRREKMFNLKDAKRRREDDEESSKAENSKTSQTVDNSDKKGKEKSGTSEDIRRIIGNKRRKKNARK